jgi:hypothetical protein
VLGWWCNHVREKSLYKIKASLHQVTLSGLKIDGFKLIYWLIILSPSSN